MMETTSDNEDDYEPLRLPCLASQTGSPASSDDETDEPVIKKKIVERDEEIENSAQSESIQSTSKEKQKGKKRGGGKRWV